MKQLQTFKFCVLSLLIFSSLTTGCIVANSVEEHINQGVTNYEAGNFEQAIEDYDQSISLDPNFIEAYVNRGHCYRNMGEFQQAVESYNQAINLNPKHAQAYFLRAFAYKEQSKKAEAIADLEKLTILKL